MAKSNLSNKFRKVDVDQFDEDRFQDEEVDDGSTGVSESEINSLLSKDKHAEALLMLMKSAPVNSKNQGDKDRASSLVIRVLTSFKGDQDAVIKSMDAQSVDILMKYIYRGFAEPSDNSSAALLIWHQKAFAIGGLGSIMRVMTDRKRV